MSARSVLAIGVVLTCIGCGMPRPQSVAIQVQNRNELIGGQDALGDVGDFKLSNGKVQFIIQGLNGKTNYSRGWGPFGGDLLDADLVRPGQPSASIPLGHDYFGEMFAGFFLEAIAPNSITIGNDGANGQPASIVVKGTGGPFLTMARNILQLAGLDNTNSDGQPLSANGIEFTTTYSLGPQDQYLTVTSSLRNPHQDLHLQQMAIPESTSVLAIPFGQVLLFGNMNNVFIPGAGFDIFYSLQDLYTQPARLPALPGILTDIVATVTPGGVSYGVAIAPPADPETSYVFHNRGVIPGAQPDQMLVPFLASSFTGVFSAQPPALIKAGDSFSYTTYFIVGQGDVGSVRDVAYGINGKPTGTISARVREQDTDLTVPGAMLLILDKDGKPFSENSPDLNGNVVGKLEPGSYQAVVVCDNRPRSQTIPFTVTAGHTTYIAGSDGRTMTVPRNAILNVQIYESADSRDPNRALPARVTLVGTAQNAPEGVEARKFLFNLSYGDRQLPTDLSLGNTRPYVERMLLSDSTGLATGDVLPGTYEVYVSRGPEYSSVDLGSMTLTGGHVYQRDARLKRVVNTTGYISADLHIHSQGSIDGHLAPDQRILSHAAEGIELMGATDHNMITDYSPLIQTMNQKDFVHSTIGVEMTTLEMGHFNGYPLTYEPGAITHGAFFWENLPPAQLFEALRDPDRIGMPDTIVQLNHCRDTIMGLFNQFNVNQDTGEPQAGSLLASPNGPAFGDGVNAFSWNFDAMEIFNSKRRDLVRTYRMPNPKPANLPSNYWTSGEGSNPGDIIRVPCSNGPTGCDYSKQSIAFPGEVEDWFNILNSGGKAVATKYAANPDLATSKEIIHPVTGMGNADSHQLYFEEAGYPRNFFKSPTDEPREVTDQDLTAAVRAHEVVVSMGPFITATLTDPANGHSATVGDLLSTTSTNLNLHIHVEATDWVQVDQLEIDTNAAGSSTLPGSPGPQIISFTADNSNPVRYDASIPFAVPHNADDSPDAWVVVIVSGSKSLFPFVTPMEQPPVSISQAISAIAGPLGLSGPDLGVLAAPTLQPMTAYAITNPIWIDTNGDGVSFGRKAQSN